MLSSLLNRIKTLTLIPRQCVSVLRLKTFDTSTPEGRSKERYRRAAVTALASGGARVASILTLVISVPLTVTYLGSERYGLWMTISSLVIMMGFADLGMGLGLMNAVSEAHGKDDREAACHFVSSGFFMLSALALAVIVVFSLAYSFIPWPALFNVKSALSVREAGPAMAVFIFCFALNFPLGVVQRVQMGYQEGYLNSLWEGLGKVMGLLGLLVVIYCKAGLVWLVLAVSGAPLIATLLNGLSLFKFKRPWLRPRWEKSKNTYARKLLHIGMSFFILQIGFTIIYNSDNFIIAQLLGPEAVTQYSVPYRMFCLPIMLLNMFIAPLWPAYGEAITRGDIGWVQRTYHRSIVFVIFLIGLPSLLLVIFGLQILQIWVGPTITPSFSLLAGLGAWSIVYSLGSAMAILLSGANIFRFQVLCTLLTLIFVLIAKIVLARFMGLTGIVWGTVIAFSLFFLLPYMFYIIRLIGNMHLMSHNSMNT